MKPTAATLGELKASGYTPKTIKQELRQNLLARLEQKKPLFAGVLGYEDTVIPDLERAILSGHNINLLGLRGQAKTRLARLMVELLDEWIPVVKDAELNDDPFQPLSRFALDRISELGDACPIDWMHRSSRYAEKLATPDVTVADLIGDVDPIKAANLRLSYADERVLHYGIIPRSNRCIFVINELPDLQARIQVALFNILQEGDVQIRGFKLRLPLDVQFVFTANPEDYTNRGSIVTPLKDRIGSQILTHYPQDISIAVAITKQEARIDPERLSRIGVPEPAFELLELIGMEARKSEFVDAKSGVSARLGISAYQNLVSAAERRMLINQDPATTVRVTDLVGVIPAITGKVELVYEGEQEGSKAVAQHLIGQAIKACHLMYFPSPENLRKKNAANVYQPVLDWFSGGGTVDLMLDADEATYSKTLQAIPGLLDLAKKHTGAKGLRELLFFCELILHALAEYGKITKSKLEKGFAFRDTFNSMFDLNNLTEPGESK